MTNSITDNEIIKAFEICESATMDCVDCPYYNQREKGECLPNLMSDVLNIINRQKADYDKLYKSYLKNKEIFAEQSLENERLKAEIEQYKDYNAKWAEKCNELKAEIERLSEAIHQGSITTEIRMKAERHFQWQQLKRIEHAKAEAVKEFAQRLKEKISDELMINVFWLDGYLDYLLREMAGETNVNNNDR